MQVLIGKTLSIVQVSIHVYAMNDSYVSRFSIHKQMSHKIGVRWIWRSDTECLVSKVVKSIPIQVKHEYVVIANCLKLYEITKNLQISIHIKAARWRKHRRQYLTKMMRPFSSVGSNIVAASHTNGCTYNLHHHLQRRLDYGVTEIEAELNGSTAFFEESSSLAGTGKYWNLRFYCVFELNNVNLQFS